MALCQDPRPFKGRLLLSHRKARLAPSSGKAHLERAFQAASIKDPDGRSENPPEAVPKKEKTSPSSRPQEAGTSRGVASGSVPVQGAPPSIA